MRERGDSLQISGGYEDCMLLPCTRVIVRSSLERDRPERGEAVSSYLVTTKTMYNVSTYVFLLLRHVILNILDVGQGH